MAAHLIFDVYGGQSTHTCSFTHRAPSVCVRAIEGKIANMQLTKKHHKGKTTKEVVATAQDIKYARFLAGNDKVIRDKAIKSLKKWFEQRCRSQIRK